jgi:response regulator RpfG family c-di-GMP phosphodiesterase
MDDKAKILLVDDREENLIALEAILSSLDQGLVRARTGEQALKALLTDEYAVILLDIVMPGMDGFETARDIKRRRKTRDVPIIFLTAVNSDPDYAFRGYAAGAVDFIAKPFDPWVLRAKVSVFVELYTKNLQLREQAAQLREQAAQLREQAAQLREQAAQLREQAAQLRTRFTGPSGETSGLLGAIDEHIRRLLSRAPADLAEDLFELEKRISGLRGALGSDPSGRL